MMDRLARRAGLRWLLGVVLCAGLALAHAQETEPAPQAPADPAVWGVYADLLNRQWHAADGSRLVVTWLTPGEELLESAPGSYRIPAKIKRDAATGTLRYREQDLFTPVFIGRVQPDGSVQFENDTLFKTGFRMVMGADGQLQRQWLKFKGAQATVNPKYSTSYRSSEAGQAPVQAIAQSPAPPSTAAQSGAHPDAAASTTGPGDSEHAPRADAKWAAFGPLARFVGSVLWDEANEEMLIVGAVDGGIGLASPDRSATDLALRAVITGNWRGKPVLLKKSYGIDGFKQTGEMLPSGAIRFHYSNMLYGADFTDTFSLQPGGGLRWEQHSKGGGSESVVVRTYVALDEKDDAQARAKAQRHADKNRRLGIDTDSFNKAVAALGAERRAAEERAQEEKEASGGGMLRSLIGAAVAGGMASAGGLDGDQVMGAALKGAQIFNPDSAAAAALGATGDQMLGTGGGAVSAASAVSGGGSYATRPNLAIGACAGFTESNYRQKAVSGGGDQQLYAMCGQAFEYYTMYKRAIAQGYSEADANRTYAAHQQSAQVAQGYLQSHGAD